MKTILKPPRWYRAPLSCLPVLCVLALAACASMAPPHERPARVVAALYPTAGNQGAADAAAIGWRDYFTDPDLRTLMAQALANNRDLRITLLHVAEARAAYGIQRADRLPSIGAQAGLDRSRTPADLSITGAPLLASQYQVMLGLASWEIDFWGRVRSLQAAALENYLATDAARRSASILLIAQVANAYLTLCELDERMALARQTVTSRSESFRIFTRRVELGATSRLDLTQVQTLLTQAQALAAQLEQARAAQLNGLTLLVGAPLDLPALAGRLEAQPALAELRPGLPSELLNQRPDILAAEHQLKAAEANIGAARAAFFPRIALTASAGSASSELSGLFAAGSQAWVFSPSISLPIFNAGRLRNNLDLAQVRRELAVAGYEKTVQGAFRDVADALSARRWLGEQLRIAQSGLATQRERAHLSQLRYGNGAAAYLDVLDAQRELLAAEQMQVQTRRALLSSQVALYAALGGGAVDYAPLPSQAPPAANRETSPP
jgi:multidrug efflux system outer membrane protein